MKKTERSVLRYLALLAFVAIVVLMPKGVWAGASDFTIENGVLTKYNGSGGDVTIPDGVISIGEGAFCDCESLSSVIIPDGVTSIGKSAFFGCTSLSSVTIPNGVTSIDDHAFRSCRSLGSITIPNSVTGIGRLAFNGCRSLSSVTIPNSVTSIGDHAFFMCSGLTSISVDTQNAVYDSRENCNAIIEKESNTLILGTYE